MIEKNQYFVPQLEYFELAENGVSGFDVNNIELETLLLQTGYMTVKDKYIQGGKIIFKLGYPNFEVRSSLTNFILNQLAKKAVHGEQNALYKAIEQGNMGNLRDVFYSFFASIPNDWYRKNTLAKYEGYYGSIFIATLPLWGLMLSVRIQPIGVKLTLPYVLKSTYIFLNSKWWSLFLTKEEPWNRLRIAAILKNMPIRTKKSSLWESSLVGINEISRVSNGRSDDPLRERSFLIVCGRCI